MSFFRSFFLYLVPSLVRVVASLALVPLTTYVLDPADFGLVALVTAVTALGGTVATVTCGFILASHYQELDQDDRQGLISTLIWFVTGAATILAGGVFAIWPALELFDPEYAVAGSSLLALAAIAMVGNVVWVVSLDVIILDQRPGWFATINVIQTAANALVVLTGLYVFHWGIYSMFAGLVAMSLVGLFGGGIVLREHLAFRFEGKWLREILRLAPATTASAITDGLQMNVERAVLLRYLNLGSLGLYTHSNQYRMMTHTVVKAAANTIWPSTLEEARHSLPEFGDTNALWSAVYVGITSLGLALALFSVELIGLLTHGKFIEAAPLLPYWMIYLLVQNSGKAQTGILIGRGHGRIYSIIMIIGMVLWVPAIIFLVPPLGILGGVISMIILQLIMRVGVQFASQRIQRTPWADHWALVGSILILALTLVLPAMDLSLVGKGIFLGVGLTLILLLGRRVIMRFVRQFVMRSARVA